MSNINLLNIQPHQVSKDMRGYSVFFYGEAKSGKTTIATKFPQHLLLAFEKGFNAIPGAMAQPINSWAEFKNVLRQLKSQEVHDKFSTIIIDTADIAYSYCEKYVCSKTKRPDGSYGYDTIADIPYGGGYHLTEKEFDECLRKIVQMDYGLVLISHAVDKVFKDESGHEYNQIVPTLDTRARKVVTRMADIVGYSRAVMDDEGNVSTKLFMRGTPRYVAGSRFKYTPDYIDFTYDSLVAAINEAIDKQMQEEDASLFTEERKNLYKEQEADFDSLMHSFNNSVDILINQSDAKDFQTKIQPKIVEIVEQYLGKGGKVNQCTKAQTEALSLIVEDMKELLKSLKSQEE